MRITCLLECDDIMHAAESDSRIGYTVYAKELKKNPLSRRNRNQILIFGLAIAPFRRGPDGFK